MKLAYVDTSCLVAIAFAETGWEKWAARLRTFDRLVASNLLEAELRAALVRERVAGRAEELLHGITWLYPNRSLGPEIQQVAAHGYLRGADLWHLACALFLEPQPAHLTFLTLDRQQKDVAVKLGLRS